MKKLDLKGKRFGKLLVIEEHSKRLGVNKSVAWDCICDCGNKVTVVGTRLKASTRSCGCILSEATSKRNTTHGKTHTSEYRIYRDMIRRCTDQSRDSNGAYFSKGVTVCERWLESFENFYEDMGDRPSHNHSIERKDNTIGYFPNNCEWIPLKQQSRNHTKQKNNTTGVTGVSFCKNKNSYVAIWNNLQNIQKTKSFSINKYGEELAFFAACECREQMIELLNKNGAGYGENHGK